MNKIFVLYVCLLGVLGPISANASKASSTGIVHREKLHDYDVKKKVIMTPDAPKPIGPYNQAVQINYILYLSGQIGIVPATGQLISDNVGNQTQQVFRNIQAVLHAAGADFTQVARCLVLLTDMNDFQLVNAIYASIFSSMEDYPARTTFAVKTLPANAKVEIECTAYTKME